MNENTRVAELHRLARQDYAKGQQERAAVPNLFPSYAAGVHAPEPSDLDVAIRVGQSMLARYGTVDSGDIFDYAQAHGGLTEALRILLRAHGVEPADHFGGAARKLPAAGKLPDTAEPEAFPRCPATHPEDPTPCGGPVVVTVLDATNAGANGCEHHGARLLASLDGARVYALPDAPQGAAIRVFKAADTVRPFAWADGPRTRAEQLSRAETRARGEGQ